MKKRIVCAACILLALIMPLSASGLTATKLNIMVLSGTTGLSLVRMLSQNPGFGEGVEGSYTVLKSPDQMVARVISGEADIAALPTNTAAALYNKGIPIQLAAITNWGVTYLVGRESGIHTWKDLKGQSVALTGRGAPPDILFRYFLNAQGLQAGSDVTTQYYAAPVELAQLMIAGKVNLATLPEPWVTEVMQKDPSVRILLDYQQEWSRLEKRRESYPQSCLVVKADLARQRPGIIREFLKQAGAASDWVNAEPGAAGRLAEQYLFISAASAEKAIPRCNLRFETAAAAQNEVDYYLRKLYEFDPQSIGGKLPDARFYLQN